VHRYRDRKIGGYGRHRKHGYRKSLRKVGAENAYHRTQISPKKICKEFQRSEKEGDVFLSRIVTGGET
jgi:hypothetical protein